MRDNWKTVLLPLAALLANGTAIPKRIPIQKCCPSANEVIDVNQRCVPMARHLQASGTLLLEHLKEELCRLHGPDWTNSNVCSNQVELAWRIDPLSRPIPCSTRKQLEFNLLDVRADGSTLIQGPAGVTWIRPDPMAGACMDMATMPNGELEGPIFRVCSSATTDAILSVSDLGTGFVTKCCPMGSALDAVEESCVPIPPQLEPARNEWIAPRSVRHPTTGSAFTRNVLKILNDDQSFKKVCQISGLEVQMDEPLFILSNGQAVIQDAHSSHFSHVNYICADRYLIKDPSIPGSIGGISPLTTFRCVPNKGQTSSRVGPSIAHAPAPSSTVLMEVCNEAHDLCIPKCCGLNQVFHRNLRQCIEDSTGEIAFQPHFHGENYPHAPLDVVPEHYVLERQFYLLNDNECSENNFTNLEEKNISIKLLANGMVHVDALEGAWQSQFCVDNFFDEASGHIKLSGFKCIDSLGDYVASEDLRPPKANLESAFRLIYIICGSISALFLVVTAIIYVSLPHLRNLHGKLVLSNVVAIFLTTVGLLILFNVAPITMQPITDSPTHSEFLVFLPAIQCKLVGYAVYYLGISMFAWMTIMCVDACWTFAMARVPKKRSDWFMFTLYSIIGWGGPMAQTLLLLGIEAKIVDVQAWGAVLPDIGRQSCFLSTRGVRYYFYIPVFLLLVVNGVMFVITYHSIRKSLKFSKEAGIKRISTTKGRDSHRTTFTSMRCESRRLSRSKRGIRRTAKAATTTSNKVADLSREEFSLFVKLFVIMGLSWALEIVHIELHGDHSAPEEYSTVVEILFRIGGIFNVSRGIFIFLVFICKRSIFVSLRNSYPKLMQALTCCCSCLKGQSPNRSAKLTRAMIPLHDTECLTSLSRPRTVGSFGTNFEDEESSLPLATPTFNEDHASLFSSSPSCSEGRLAMEAEPRQCRGQGKRSIWCHFFSSSPSSEDKGMGPTRSVRIVENHPNRRYSTTNNHGSSTVTKVLVLDP